MKRAAESISTTSDQHRILECPDCQKPFRSDNLKRHNMKTHTLIINPKCVHTNQIKSTNNDITSSLIYTNINSKAKIPC